MNLNKKTVFTPYTYPSPAPSVDGADTTKISSPSDIRSTVSDPSSIYPTTTALLYAIPINTLTPVHTNTPMEPTEVFKNDVNHIIEAITYLADYMSYELKKGALETSRNMAGTQGCCSDLPSRRPPSNQITSPPD